MQNHKIMSSSSNRHARLCARVGDTTMVPDNDHLHLTTTTDTYMVPGNDHIGFRPSTLTRHCSIFIYYIRT